jgi:hypothetical protein
MKAAIISFSSALAFLCAAAQKWKWREWRKKRGKTR